MSAGYHERKPISLSAEKEVVRRFEKLGRIVYRTGLEVVNEELSNLLVERDSPLSLFLRNTPDLLVVDETHGEFYCDVKRGKLHIAKPAYEAYMAIPGHGRHIVLVFQSVDHGLDFYWQWLSTIRFLDSRDVVGKQKDPARRFPIDDDGWMHPRRVAHYDPATFPGSGEPYKAIEFESLLRWES